jgi:hypothetical protein
MARRNADCNSLRGAVRITKGDWLFLIILLGVSLVLRLVILNINGGEYTDGMIQLTGLPAESQGLYPPLYGWLARFVAGFSHIGLETAGKLISAVASSLTLVPLFFMASRVGGSSTGRMAALLYAVSPMPLRWGIRVMTDSLFLFFVTWAMRVLVEASDALARHAWTCEGEERRGLRWAWQADVLGAGFVIIAALATLTRYQGVVLVPLGMALFVFFVVRRLIPALFLVSGLVWIPVAMEMARGRAIHGGQFAQRMTPDTVTTALSYWNNFESFVLVSPYYFCYPVALFAIVGVVVLWLRSDRGTVSAGSAWVGTRKADDCGDLPGNSWFGWSWVFFGVAILLLQSAFGSFQYRYMLPLLPGVLCVAGAGLAGWEKWSGSGKMRRGVFRAGMLVSIVYMAVFSTAVLLLQRDSFADQRMAADFIRMKVSPQTPVFSNERYGSFEWPISLKLTVWSGRPVRPLFLKKSADGLAEMPAGAVVVLGNEYGGNEALTQLMGVLGQRYMMESLTRAPFNAEIVPLMDDIMVNPMFNQNPLAWVLRYSPQMFSTAVYRVTPHGGEAHDRADDRSTSSGAGL